MNKSIVYMIKDTPLSQFDIFQILQNPDHEKVSNLPAVCPSHGQVYLFSYEGRPNACKDWRADQYQWIHMGIHALPRTDPKIKKTYHQRLIGKKRVNFHRYGYEKIDIIIKMVVVHYMGEMDAPVKEAPHGSMRTFSQQSHIRTMPSVLANVSSQKGETASAIYKQNIVETKTTSMHMNVQLPKNAEQISNKLKYERKKGKIHHDDLYSVYELHFAIEKFISTYSLVPEFAVVLALPEIVREFVEVCSVISNPVIYYDTTFQLGDFYVSPLIFRCSFFKEDPCIPLAVVIHESKSLKVHKTFFSNIKELIPCIDKSDVIIVTDREAAITKAISSIVPNMKHVLCWNHLLKDVETWVTSHEGMIADRKVYVNHVLCLLDNDSLADFETRYDALKQKWSLPFLNYFDTHLKKDIIQKSGKWVLQELNIYNRGSGVTTNVSESMNAVLKRMTEWKEVRLEQMVLAIYFLQTFYLKEILRGKCSSGNYHLCDNFTNLQLDSTTVCFPADYMTVDELIIFLESNTYSSKETEKKEVKKPQSMANQGLAEMCVEQNRVFLQAQSAVFIVRGLQERNFVVSLFPQEKCSCNSTRTCYHILAARLSVGKKLIPTKTIYSLKKLKVGSRRYKSGRKIQRQKIEVTSLPSCRNTLMPTVGPFF